MCRLLSPLRYHLNKGGKKCRRRCIQKSKKSIFIKFRWNVEIYNLNHCDKQEVKHISGLTKFRYVLSYAKLQFSLPVLSIVWVAKLSNSIKIYRNLVWRFCDIPPFKTTTMISVPFLNVNCWILGERMGLGSWG